MVTRTRVSLLRSGNRLVVDPTTPRVLDVLTPSLRYVEKVFARGMERIRRKRNRLPLFDETEWECYGLDVKNRLATSFGFYERITALLRANGFDPVLSWASKVEAAEQEKRAATAYAARWDRIEEMVREGFEFRYMQREALEAIANNPNGRIDCHTGWGKGTLIMLAAVLFPRAKIDVVAKRVEVVHTRLYPELCLNLPSVGLVGGGKKIKGERVMCYTADSLHHGRPDADMVFVDEGQEACADKFAAQLGIYEHARMYSFSASWDMRLDNKDLRGEAMFGPIRVVVPYQTGVEKGIVVPIKVVWGDVILDENPCGGLDDLVARKRAGVWRNDARNRRIAADARKYGPDVQTLITVETLEHALELKKLLPHFKVVYAGQGLSETDVLWFKKHYPDQFQAMTPERKARITRLFSAGKIKKAIATTVWNVGVDFRHLEVLIRGDAGGSPINDVQIPGRNSRPKRAADVAAGAAEKTVGIVHDYLDQFDSGFRQRAAGRRKSYERNGWEQEEPDRAARSALRKRLNMGGGT